MLHSQKWLYFFVRTRSSMRANSPFVPNSLAGCTRVLVGAFGSKLQRYMSETNLLRCKSVVGVLAWASGGKKKNTLSDATVRSTMILPSSSSYEPATWPWKPASVSVKHPHVLEVNFHTVISPQPHNVFRLSIPSRHNAVPLVFFRIPSEVIATSL